ncbi:MAG: YfhO family protein [Rhodanobacter sp.]|nr:YfhO family protein [Rhodanobacter sp.]
MDDSGIMEMRLSKKWFWLGGMLLLSLLICLPLMKNNIYFPSHEQMWGPMRIWGIGEALKSGQWPPQVLPNLAGELGYGWHIFYPPLAYWFAYVFYGAGLSLLAAIKSAHVFSLFLSGVTMFLFVRRVTSNERLAGIAGLLYLSAPYHMIDFYVRNAYAETFAFIWIPVIFLGAYEILQGDRKKWWILTIGMSGMLLTHIISAFYSLFFLTLFVIIQITFKLKEQPVEYKACAMVFIKAAALTLVLTAFFFMPMFEHMEMGDYAAFSREHKVYFWALPAQVQAFAITLPQMFDWHLPLSQDLFGSRGYHYQGPQMPLTVGPLLALLALIGLLRKHPSRLQTVFMVLAILSLFMTLWLMPWTLLPEIFSLLQFPWRLLLFATFFLCFLSIHAFDESINKFIKTAAYMITLTMAVLLFHSVRMVTTENIIVKSILHEPISEHGTSDGEYFPVNYLNTLIMPSVQIPIQDPALLNGTGHATVTHRNGVNLTLDVMLETKEQEFITLQIPLIYYLGYRITDTSGAVLKRYECKSGLLCVDIDKSGIYKVRYRNTLIGKIGNTLSIMAIFILAGVWFRNRSPQRIDP